MAREEAGIADKWLWRRRMFASVDVVGSTAFKAAMVKAQSKIPWSQTFTEFFDEFPQTFGAELKALGKSLGNGTPTSTMGIWKFVGDEILFDVELTDHLQVLYFCTAFRNALRKEHVRIRSKQHQSSLGLKGTIWGAGFPVSNTEVVTEFNDRNGKPTQLRDFIGPCVDTGFRLATKASERRIPISADIAYFLSLQTSPGDLRVHIEPPETFKGVNQGRAYPVIWIEWGTDRNEEDKLLGRKEGRKPADLADYLTKEVFRDEPGELFRPFICNDAREGLNQVPENFTIQRKNAMGSTSEPSLAGDEPTTIEIKSTLADPVLPTKP